MGKLITDDITLKGVNLEDAEPLVDGKFGEMNFLPSSDKVCLTVLETSKGFYAVATKTQVPDDQVSVTCIEGASSISGYPVTSGTCGLNATGNPTNIELKATEATAKLRFENQNIVKITGSSDNDVICINTQGVATNAELDFSQGEADTDNTDTIYFNGATTVQNIFGGGQTRIHLL